MEINEPRTSIVALAKDLKNKNAFIFNSSLGLPTPTNKYKRLLDFFEVSPKDIDNIVSLDVNVEYDYDRFSYSLYEELPYPNYHNRDQKKINPIKEHYIGNYDDIEFPLYNLKLNKNVNDKLEKTHKENFRKLYGELHYKRLLELYNQLEQLEDYELVSSYLSDDKRIINAIVPVCEISKRYFSGDIDAGIEILLRKRKRELDIKLSNCEHIKKLVFNFDILLNAYKLAMNLIGQTYVDYETKLLSLHLKNNWKVEDVLSLLVDESKETIIKYVEGKADIGIWIEKLNSKYYWFRDESKEYLMGGYIQEKKDTELKICLLLALYEKQTNLKFNR